MLHRPGALAESGIVTGHQSAFAQVALRNDVVIMVRNVNKLCTSLIEHDYPTKGMSVHGKSSDWGPQAGLICVNQELSKYQGKDRVSALNKEVEHSLGAHGKGDVKAVPMQLPAWRLEELRAMGLVSIRESKWVNVGHGRNVRQIVLQCPGRPHHFTLRSLEGDARMFDVRVHINHAEQGQPVLVISRKVSLTGKSMTDSEGRLPLTADYDLFCVCPNFQVLDLAREDRFANNRADLPELPGKGHFAANSGMKGRYRAPAALNSGAQIDLQGSFASANGASAASSRINQGRAHGVLGHTTMRQEHIRKQLNGAINATYRGGDTVHHGAEVMNPFPEADDFGITVFWPDGHAWGLQNITDLNRCYETLRTAGYYMHVNPLWGWRPAAARRAGEDNAMRTGIAVWRQ